MAHVRWLAILVVWLAGLAEGRAQIVFYSNPYGYDGVIYSRGLGFSYHHHRRKYWGYYGAAAPYGVSVKDVTVVVQPPPVVVRVREREPEPDDYDTRGIDLDEIDPATMRRRPQPPARERIPDRPEPPREKPKPPRPPEPPPEDDASLMERGKKAFTAREYGLAAQHFRLAIREGPRDALPHFLLAQAQFALGKFRDAVESIHAGLDLKRDWPRAKFRVRELYGEHDNDFLGHVKRLEDVLDTRPDDAALLFLLAYELWFDGKPARARMLFEKAKRFAADAGDINRFLE
jgi:hypothetical protein